MKILMISNDKTIFESGSPVERRLAALAEAAGEIAVIAPASRGGEKRISSRLMAYARGGGKAAQFYGIFRKAARLLKNSRHNLISVQDTAYLALLAWLLARRFGLPLEIQVHGFEKFFGLRKIIAGFVLRRADKIRAVSKRLKKFIKSEWRDTKAEIYTLPIYAQIVIFDSGGESADRPAPERPLTLLAVSRLVPVKNIEMQIRAFARFVKEFPNSRLVIVGGGPMYENLESRIRNYELEDKIFLEGKQANVSKYYENAELFLLTSDSEGWGVAAVEAAAYGLPVIMTDVGLAGEFIKDGRNGLVIPAADEQALLAAMRVLAMDSDLRERLGRAARKDFLDLPPQSFYIQKQIAEWQTLASS